MKTNIQQYTTQIVSALQGKSFFLVALTALAAVAFISCEERDLGKTIEIVEPPLHEFQNLEWRPGDRFEVMFEVIAHEDGKEIGNFDIGLGRYEPACSQSTRSTMPEEIVLSESFSSKKKGGDCNHRVDPAGQPGSKFGRQLLSDSHHKPTKTQIVA